MRASSSSSRWTTASARARRAFTSRFFLTPASARSLQPPVLLGQHLLAPVDLVGRKRFAGIGQKLVAPLVIQRLADLVLAAQLAHRPPAQPLDHHLRLGLV